jgi:hypothetical protein
MIHLQPIENSMNRRSRTRFKTDLTAIVTCSDTPGIQIKARLADLSVHGLSIIVNKELTIGSAAKVQWGNVTFVGELVYCKTHGKEFLVGLKVEEPVYETTRKET